MEITLSDGYTTDIRQLGLFEIDNVSRPDLSPFTYNLITVTGDEVEVIHDISRYKTTPQKPDVEDEDLEKGSPYWHDLREWELYMGALTHQQLMQTRLSNYISDLVDYIVDNCVDNGSELRKHIIDWRDAEIIMWHALLEPITIDMIQDVLRDTYQATYNKQDIMTALSEVEGGSGVYNAIRVWENKLMISMNMSELEYVLMDAKERCRKICAMMIDKWLEYLELQAQIKESALKK